MIEIISDPARIIFSEWKNFVLNHPKGNIFQTPEMYQVYLSTKYYEPSIIIAIEDNRIVGVLLSLQQKESNALFSLFSSRCIVQGGPIIKNDSREIAQEMLKFLTNSIKNKTIYTQFRNFFNLPDISKAFQLNGYLYEPHLNIQINLDRSFNELKSDVHPSRIRNYSKALKKGVEIRELINLDEIKKAYNLLIETYNKIKLPLVDISHFFSLANNLIPIGMCKYYGLFFENEIIGIRVVLQYKKIIYDYYAGSSIKHSNKYPNDVLILYTLNQGCSGNFEYFDFGGAGKPNLPYGVRDHKLKFGGNLVEYGRYTKFNKPVFYKISMLGFNIWKKLK